MRKPNEQNLLNCLKLCQLTELSREFQKKYETSSRSKTKFQHNSKEKCQKGYR